MKWHLVMILVKAPDIECDLSSCEIHNTEVVHESIYGQTFNSLIIIKGIYGLMKNKYVQNNTYIHTILMK